MCRGQRYEALFVGKDRSDTSRSGPAANGEVVAANQLSFLVSPGFFDLGWMRPGLDELEPVAAQLSAAQAEVREAALELERYVTSL